MRRSLWILAGCAAAMGIGLCGCGKDTGSVGEDSGGAQIVPKEAMPDQGSGKDGNSEKASQDAAGTAENTLETPDEITSDAEVSGDGGENMAKASETAAGTTLTQAGPFGSISVTVPEGWKYELCPMDSDSLLNGDYGIYFSPEEAEFGFVEIAYIRAFGVCGTGLAQEEVTVAGYPAWKGTYDGHAYWDFINFGEPMRDVVAMTSSVEEWWEENEDTVMEILDTFTFDPNARQGGAYIYKAESENDRIGLYLSLEGISSTGALLCYNQYDKEAPTGQLQDGDDFVIEVKKEGKWEKAPIVVEGEYAFNSIAYTISPEDTTRRALDWKWLYGELAPGEYRIGKSVLDFRGTGDYDKYEVYAYFILN